MPMYVVQTTSGKEKQLCNQIAKRIDDDVVSECFVPCSEIAKRYGGTWHRTERPLFPGYVFVDTADLEGFKRELRSIEGLTKVLGYEEGPQALNEDEMRGSTPSSAPTTTRPACPRASSRATS